MRRLAPLLILAALAPGAQAQTAPSEQAVRQLQVDDKLMPALAMLEQLVAVDPSAAGWGAQMWAFSGDVATADALFARSSPRPGGRAPDLSQARPEPAIAAILRAAEGRRVVIINEAHHAPRHRAFTHRLMLALREAGFTHFAAEAFPPRPPTDGVPRRESGYYVSDPVFGDLVRQAMAAGYVLTPYEMSFERVREREGLTPEQFGTLRDRAQAENIKAVLDADPEARILVHSGFGHLNEGPIGALRPFGLQLGELTGEDPLTIDQTEGTPQHDAAYDSSLYRAFLARFGWPAVPVAITNDPAQPLGAYRVDLSVIHPTPGAIEGRPGWLAMDGYRRPHEVMLAPLGGRSLVRAFVAGEPAGAIAMDQMLVGPGAASVTLMLPPGTYRLVRQTEAGEDLPFGEVRIR
ncbi:MAG TPA: hypothetical protein VI168_13945 [Croceibacterium sp.]